MPLEREREIDWFYKSQNMISMEEVYIKHLLTDKQPW